MVGRFFLTTPALGKEEREAQSSEWRLATTSKEDMRGVLLQVVPAASVSLMLSEDAAFLEVLAQWRDMLDDNDDVQEVYHNWEIDSVLLRAGIPTHGKYLWFALYHREPETRDVIVSTLDRLLLKTINNE